jgi:transcriptional regulator with XRE-family HTH domain
MLTAAANFSSDQHWREFGLWLKRERERAGLTQREVAGKVKIHPVQLSRIENGDSGTRRETVFALAAAIGFDLREGLRKAGFDLGTMPPSQDHSLNDIGVMFYGWEDASEQDKAATFEAIKMIAESFQRRRTRKKKA